MILVVLLEDYDVVIFGGGISGVACGIGLARAGVSVMLVEKRREILQNTHERVFALSKRSKEILETLDSWDKYFENAPIEHIMIYDGDSASQVHYDEATVGEGPMGYVVEARGLASSLKNKVSFVVSCSDECKDYKQVKGHVEVLLDGGRKVRTKVVVCADGKNSELRRRLGIEEYNYNFGQSCFVCNVSHEKNHKKTAIEHFFPKGPFAMLPMERGHRTSIVWTEETKRADLLKKLSKEGFTMALQEKCFYHLGEIELDSEILCFPITMMIAKKQVRKNAILLGDAAHSIHPVAGQGLNLGLRDVAAIIETLKKYKATGTDLGRPFILREIEEKRALDNALMSMMTTLINNIFSSDNCLMKLVRRAAMASVEATPTMKRILISHAMGIGEICQ